MEKPRRMRWAAGLILVLAATADCYIQYRWIPEHSEHTGHKLADDLTDLWSDVMEYYTAENKDPCISNPCFHQGTCRQTHDGFECVCTPFFLGKYCQIENRLCQLNPCVQGVCVLTKTPPYHRCRCHPSYAGPRCSTAIEPCSQKPCLNGGVCRSRSNNTFTCICPQPYRGSICESVVNECYEGNGGQYRGMVSRTVSGFRCLPWDSFRLVGEEINAFAPWAREYGIGEHNFCRNPDDTETPWCYFRDATGKLAWDFCLLLPCVKSSTPIQMFPPTPVPKPTPKILPRPTQKLATTQAPPPKEAFAICGVPEIVKPRGRIIGGKRTTPGRHPWQASIGLKVRVLNHEPGHQCGGSLISSCWVLTAAHCFPLGIRKEHLKISLGKHDIMKNETYEQIFDVQEFVAHEKFESLPQSLRNDIALVKLKPVNGKCAVENKYVKTVCLPDREFAPGKDCFVSGWGMTETGYAAQLMDTNVLLISEERCSEPQSYGKHIDNSMLCAGILEGGTDACRGDSGGPLTCENDGAFQLTGVVSWGEQCALKDKPGVYAHVYRFLPWIREKMRTL